jgi:nucleotide-binding universal stress UspA family protein
MKILVALDYSSHSLAATRFLKRLSLPPGSSVLLLFVTDPASIHEISKRCDDVQEPTRRMVRAHLHLKEAAHKYLSSVKAMFRAQDLSVESVVRHGIAGAEIIKLAQDERIDLVVVGSRGMSSVKKFFLGGVSEWVLNDAPCSVLVVRKGSQGTSLTRKGLHFLVTTDGSPDAQMAVEFMKELAPPSASVLTLVHVVQEYFEHVASRVVASHRGELVKIQHDLLQRGKHRGVKLLGDTAHELRQRGWQVRESLRIGQPADQILKSCVHAKPDVVVVGSRGLTGLKRFFLGSVSHKVARDASVSVLMVRKARSTS